MFCKTRLLPVLALPAALLTAVKKKKRPTVGGQAIIEGVMMRGKGHIAWAVRKATGTVAIESEKFISITRRYPILRRPILRGAVSLYEALALGLRALSRSAELAIDESEEGTETPSGWKETLSMGISITLGLTISLVVFLYLPMRILAFFIPEESALVFNLLAGALRIVFFLAYLGFISLWKDIRRLFEYHGAEHKAIFAYEDGKEVTVENMQPYSTHHPRCGTSFLLITALVCIFLFAALDAVIIHFVGSYPNVITRVLAHVALMPIVAGTSYEFLRFSGRHTDVFPISLMIKPGLFLQRITTREPDHEQMRVASQALEAVV